MVNLTELNVVIDSSPSEKSPSEKMLPEQKPKSCCSTLYAWLRCCCQTKPEEPKARTKEDAAILVEERRRVAEEKRKEAAKMEDAVKSNPNVLPEGYEEMEQNQINPITTEVPEAEEWASAHTEELQQYYSESTAIPIDKVIELHQPNLDEHKNPIGTEYDLPRDGTMLEFTVVICWFVPEGPQYKKLVDALQHKGFNVVLHNVTLGATVKQMMVSLLNASVAWLVSGNNVQEADFDLLLGAFGAFHKRGGGIFVWGDNDPFFAHANLLLEKLMPGEQVKLTGNHHGTKIMTVSSTSTGKAPGELRSDHIIMTGISSLWEGVTISYVPHVGELKVLATYNDGSGYKGQPYCVLADSEVYAKFNVPGDTVAVAELS
jgi:hypothetical protein